MEPDEEGISAGSDVGGTVRGTGAEEWWSDGFGVCSATAELPGAQRAGQPAGASAAGAGSGAGIAGGDLRGTLCGDGSGDPGGAQSRWRVSADGPWVSGGAAEFHAGRCAGVGGADAKEDPAPMARGGEGAVS